jgi:glyoxylate reductase
MARCFVTRELPGTALDRLRAEHEVEVWSDPLAPPRQPLLAGAAAADGLLAMLTDAIDAELLDAAPRLRAISNYAVGTDNVDLAAATVRGIPVGNTPDVLTDSTADLAVALMLAIARRIVEGERVVRAGEWRTWGPSVMLGRDLHGSTVGIIGAGRIGQTVARRLRGFGCELVFARRGDRAALDRLLAASDYVTIHVPLTPETHGLIGEAQLRAMKSTAYLVNTARGPIVDEGALLEALTQKKIAGAGVDVFSVEPLPVDHPFRKLDNMVITPHLGYVTEDSFRNHYQQMVEGIDAWFKGEPKQRLA